MKFPTKLCVVIPSRASCFIPFTYVFINLRSSLMQYHPITTAQTCVNFRVVATCICNRGPREVKAVVQWLKSTRDLKPCVVKSHA